VYTEENDVVLAGRGPMTYHPASPGERSVFLPAPATVRDLFTRELLGESVTEIGLDFPQPGTRVLTTLPPEYWR